MNLHRHKWQKIEKAIGEYSKRRCEGDAVRFFGVRVVCLECRQEAIHVEELKKFVEIAA